MTHLARLLPHGYGDAHHHVWAPQSRGDDIGYGWLRDIGAPKPFGDPAPIQRDYLFEEFLAETGMPPRASVHVQADGALPDPVAETAFVAAEARRVGQPVAIVGLCDLSRPDAADILDRHMAHPGVRGVRQIVGRLRERPDLSFATKDLLFDDQWIAGLSCVSDRGLSFDLQLYPEQAGAAADVLAHFPALTVIVDHALSPYDASAAGRARWRDAVRRLAARPRTLVKLSGWGMFDPGWTAASIRPLVETLLEAFGPERVMWGSNYPVEKLARPYGDVLADVAELIPEEFRRAVFLDNMTRAYRPILT